MSGEEPRWDAVVILGMKGPFNRLVRAVAAWAETEPRRRVWLQHGDSALPTGLEGAARVPREELLAHLADAAVLIVHAGTGAIRDALALGHVPVVVPRRAARGEHVNDHQMEIAQALGERVVACLDPEDGRAFAFAIERARSRRGAATRLPGDALRAAVGSRLSELTARPARRTPLVWALLGRLTRGMKPKRRDSQAP